MCYPPPRDDPGRARIRAPNTGAVIGNYQAAGAQRVIVNGVVDPVLGAQPDLIDRAELMVCRLRADRDEVVRRFTGSRQRSGGDLSDALRYVRDECDRMDTSRLGDVCVDTTGMPAAEVARLGRDSCRGWPGFGEVASGPVRPRRF